MDGGRIATIGMFDGVHLGHRYVLRRLCDLGAAHGLRPMVLTFAHHPMSLIAPRQAPRLLTTSCQKAALIAGAGVPEVVFLNFDPSLRTLTARQFMAVMRRRYGVVRLVMGYNHHFGSDRLQDIEQYRAAGAEVGVEVVRDVEHSMADGDHVSSSAIRRLVSQGDVAAAAVMLGRPFALSGTVGHGRGIGHTIGFPTANVVPYSAEQLLPGRGVYAAVAHLHGVGDIPAMVNVGYNPTVGADDRLKVEAHLIGFEGDIYGRPIVVDFERRIRDERRFGSLAELQTQLRADLSVIDNG